MPGERVAIAYEGTALPAFFFPAADTTGGGRPLVVVNNGSYQATSEMWAHAGAAAAERGYHWLTFDGPGQQAMLLERRIPFRPDWERVLTPVLDAMLARADVDPDRVAVVGVGQGGYWVARALAFEHRFAAAVVDPGIVDVATAWIDRLPNARPSRSRWWIAPTTICFSLSSINSPREFSPQARSRRLFVTCCDGSATPGSCLATLPGGTCSQSPRQ